jgi:hypothetical protein
MTDTVDNVTSPLGEVLPIRPLTEGAALDWLRGQPGGRTTLSGAEIGRRWGWDRRRVSRRLREWKRAGVIKARGSTIMVVDNAPAMGAERATSDATTPGDVARIVPSDVASPESEKRNAINDVRSDVATVNGEIYKCDNEVATFVQPRWQVGNGVAQSPQEWGVTVGERRTTIDLVACTAAIALATVSAGFSITGLTSIFTGAFWPVIAMGVALELGKLSAVACLGRQGGSRALRGALVVLVAVLMGLNAAGAYGFLAKAHIGHAVAGETAVAGRAADVEARTAVQAGIVADLDRKLGQVDGAVEKAIAKGRTGSAMALADQQRKARGELASQRVDAAKALASLQVEKATVEGQRALVDADLGPVKYLATLIGADNETVLRWFILVVACLLDPAAVVLLYAATSARRE